MRHQLAESTLVTLLREYYRHPRCHALVHRQRVQGRNSTRTFGTSTRRAQLFTKELQNRHDFFGDHDTIDYNYGSVLATSSHSSTSHLTPPQNIAILGGGITGLATAYYLSKEIPSAKISLYEATERLGGWLNSQHINIGNGSVVFEQGPRNLRPATPAGLVTLDLVKKLGLVDEMLITDRFSAAARNRYVYYPDHLVRMPGPGQSILGIFSTILTEPIFKGFIPGLLGEMWRSPRNHDLEDESVGAFLERRFGNTDVADNMVSAILHGIYAGDIYQLSMKSLQPIAWHNELEYGSIEKAILEGMKSKSMLLPYQDATLLQEMKSKVAGMSRASEINSASVYSFKKGIRALSDTLVTSLEASSKVKLNTGAAVRKVSFNGNTGRIEISLGSDEPPEEFDQVISTISGRTLSYLTDKTDDLPSLQSTHAVTVMVVNLYYNNPSILPVRGFGYLIPRSVPWQENPERALGVVFDSDASVGQDTAAGTKLTVMLGGHWWDDFSVYPDEEEGAAMAKAIIKRHLNIEEEPAAINVALQRECIPQYTVGHEARMKKAHGELMATFRGKLAVAGNSYTGVGLNDCVRAARDLVIAIGSRGPGGVTGLERFTKEQRWVKTVALPPGAEEPTS